MKVKTWFSTNIDMNYLYISHLDEGLQVWRLPSSPDSITDTMQSSFAQTNALGRSAPVYTFSQAGPRSVQIGIAIHRDLLDDVNMGWSTVTLGYDEDYLDNLLRALQAIAVPKYNLSNKAIEPPMLGLRIGRQIYIKGVLTSGIGITYEKPILANGKYAQAKLSLTISEVDPYDATSVYANGGYRGVIRSVSKNILS